MPLTHAPGRRLFLLTSFSLLFLCFTYFGLSRLNSSKHGFHSEVDPPEAATESVHPASSRLPESFPISNATLGFEKIFVINLPSRSDRRDTLTLMTAYEGIQVDWQMAVRGEEVDPKAWPAHWQAEGKQPTTTELGCWRSHVNVLRLIVEKRYKTALILEDDVDWDVRLKSQLALLSSKMPDLPQSEFQALSNKSFTPPLVSPYGMDWDLFWLGTCANPPAPADAITYNDPSGNKLRYLWNARGGTACTWAYAVTYESARMLLGYLQDINDPIDFHLGQFCQEHNCPLIWPPLFLAHKPAGSKAKDSDMDHSGAHDEANGNFREVAESPGIEQSAILSAIDRITPKLFASNRQQPASATKALAPE